MKNILCKLFLLLMIATNSSNLFAQVSNIQVKQEGLKKVLIHYDLNGNGNYEISLFLKTNTREKPVLLNRVTGDVGSGITVGKNKTIEWDATEEIPNLFTDKAEFLIQAVAQFTFLDKKPEEKEQPFGILDITAGDCSIWINDSLAGTNTVKAKFSPGAYKIRASRNDENYQDETREINLDEGETKQVELAPKLITGKVSINSTPSMAEVFLDGTTTNGLTPYSFSAPAGLHHITLQKKGYMDNSFDISINRGHTNFLLDKELIKSRVINKEVLKYKRRKTFWLISTIIAGGVGTYAYLEGNSKYDEYKNATGADVADLKNKYETLDQVYPIAFGAAGFCLVEFIIQSGKQAKAQKQVSFYPGPVKGGGGIALTYQF